MALLSWIVFINVVLLVRAEPLDTEGLFAEEWRLWKGEHKITYQSSEEEGKRYSIWQDNMKYIDEHNAKNLSFTLRMNQFGDLTSEEYSSIYTCHIVSNENSDEVIGQKYNPPRDVELPYSIDWRKKSVVTYVKSQGEYRCHSCYAFSTVGSIESHHAISTGSRVRLSEQNVIDCSTGYGNAGCNGGNYRNTFKYILENGGGIDTQNYYPYKAMDKTCRYNSAKIGATISGVYYIQSKSESDLMSAVGLVGPVIVSIDHRHKSFQFYGGGIYSETECYSNYYLLTHEMLVVGYGTYQNIDYWIVKNSYGSSWGGWGYMRILRGENMCGIATDAAFPVI